MPNLSPSKSKYLYNGDFIIFIDLRMVFLKGNTRGVMFSSVASAIVASLLVYSNYIIVRLAQEITELESTAKHNISEFEVTSSSASPVTRLHIFKQSRYFSSS